MPSEPRTLWFASLASSRRIDRTRRFSLICNGFWACAEVQSASDTTSRTTALRFMFLPQRAKLCSVYARPNYETQAPVYLRLPRRPAGRPGIVGQYAKRERLPQGGCAAGAVRDRHALSLRRQLAADRVRLQRARPARL